MGQLASGSPERYHISSPHHRELWTDAEAAYDAKITAELAAKPSVRKAVEESVRRVELNSTHSGDESSSV